MRRTRTVIGGAGGPPKGGGQTAGAKEDKDTLISKSFARVIDVLCEGQIAGFAHPSQPLQDIILDGTPMENQDSPGGHDATYSQGSNNVRFTGAIWSKQYVGRGFIGPYVPANTTITATDADQHGITMSKPATGSGSGQDWTLGGSLTFGNFAYYFLPGTQQQSFLPGFVAEENPFAGFQAVKVTVANDYVTSISPDVDAVKVTISLPRFQKQDTKTGNIHGTEARIQILLAENGTNNFNVVRDDTIKGKASSGYLRTYQVELAGRTSPFQIKVKRITPDAPNQATQNETWVGAISELVYGKLRHPNTALVGIHFDASQFSAIPTRGYHLKGLIIQIPQNYDPDLRTYATTGAGTTNGTWDGTFKRAYSNNPAWCWYAMATNKRWGLGNVVAESDINKFGLYTIAKYCDQAVPTGYGGTTGEFGNGTEPRFTCNLYIQKANDAYKVLSDMLGICRASLAYSIGQLTPVQDSPGDPAAYRMFSPVNVIGGTFTYSGTAMKARHNAVKVSWQDLSDNGNMKWEYVEDSETIGNTGVINMLEIVGFGCSSRGQARRWGLGALWMERLLTDTISFGTALEGAFVLPGQIIQVQDPFRAGAQLSGRIVSVPGTPITPTSLPLDRSITLEGGKTYTIQVIKPSDGTLVTRAVLTGAGAHQTIAVAALPFNPDDESVWQMAADNYLEPELFRVLGVTQRDLNTMDVSAIQYRDDLYDFIDFNEPLDDLHISILPNAGAVLPPGPMRVDQIGSIDNVHGATRTLEVSWVQSNDRYLEKYRFAWRLNDGNWIGLDDTLATGVTLTRVAPGSYDFRVFAINTIGLKSEPSTLDDYPVDDDSSPFPRPYVTGLELAGQGNNNLFQQRDAKFAWRLNSPAGVIELGTGAIQGGVQDPMFQAFDVRVVIPDGTTIWTDTTMQPNYNFSLDKNREGMLQHVSPTADPANRFTFQVRVLDSFGKLSEPKSLYVINPPPHPPFHLTLDGHMTGVELGWANASDPDIHHIAIFMSINSGDDSPTLVATHAFPGTSHVYNYLNDSGTPFEDRLRFFWLASVDTFGNQSAKASAGGAKPGYEVDVVNADPDGGYLTAATSVRLWCITKSVNIYFKTGTFGWRLYNDAARPSIGNNTMLTYAAQENNALIKGAVVSRTYTIASGSVLTPQFFLSDGVTPMPDVGTYTTGDATMNFRLTTGTTTARILWRGDGVAPIPPPGTQLGDNLINSYDGWITLGVANQTKDDYLKAVAFTAGATSFPRTAHYVLQVSAVPPPPPPPGGGDPPPPGTTPTCAQPTYSPGGAGYLDSQYPLSVAITSTAGATIIWTTNGQTPTPTYGNTGSPATVGAGQWLQAIAVLAGWNQSPLQSQPYTSVGQCDPPSFNPVVGDYATFPMNVTLTSTAGSHIRYTTDGSNLPTTDTGGTSVATGTTISVPADTTLKARAHKSTAPALNPSVQSGGFYHQMTPCATPTFSPANTNFNASDYPKPIQINCSQIAQIRFTRDGSSPYSGGTTINRTESATMAAGQTLKAIGIASGYLLSAVATSGPYTAQAATCTVNNYSPLPGTRNVHSLAVTISTSNGDRIRWTVDGTVPTRNYGNLISAGSGTITLTGIQATGLALRAIAYKLDGSLNDSAVKYGVYDYDAGA